MKSSENNDYLDVNLNIPITYRSKSPIKTSSLYQEKYHQVLNLHADLGHVRLFHEIYSKQVNFLDKDIVLKYFILQEVQIQQIGLCFVQTFRFFCVTSLLDIETRNKDLKGKVLRYFSKVKNQIQLISKI